MHASRFSATDLAALQRQVSGWRRAQRGRSRIPEDVWAAAAALARSQGVSRVARALHLDYHELRRRCSKGAGDSSKASVSPTFVEVQLEPSLSVPAGRWRIELQDGAAARLTIEIGNEIPALVAVVEAFWKRRP